jgi:type II secretory pathway pseudopilin PulG
MSLLETMIAIAILAVILGIAVTFLIFSNRQSSWIDTRARIQKELRGALQEMSIDIKEARQIAGGSAANKLILSLPNMNTQTGAILGYDTIVYEPSPADTTNLRMTLTTGSGSSRHGWGKKIQAGNPSYWLLTVGLVNSGLIDTPPLFQYNSAAPSDAFEITVTLKSRRSSSIGKYQEGTLSTKIRLRNKRE